MRIVSILLATALAAVACSGAAPASDPDLRIRIRLETSDPHLVGVASVDLALRRENVVVNERVAPGADGALGFPLEVVVKVPIGPGPLAVEAVPRSAAGLALGGGEGQVIAAAGTLPAVTVVLSSERQRPVRVQMGAGEARLDAAAPPPVADAGAVPDGSGPVGGAPDAGDPPCELRTRQVVAQAVLSLDYSPEPPRDQASALVRVASGFDHGHHHDFVGWIRFPLSGVPERAALTSMKVSLVLAMPPFRAPPLAITYTVNDGWTPGALPSEMAELVPRTARVSGELGLPRSSRGEYAVDVAMYERFWAGDLADDAVTLGIISTSPYEAPETWADFHGLEQELLAPVLELTTCE